MALALYETSTLVNMNKLESLIRAAMEYVEDTQSGNRMPSIEELQFCGLVHSLIEQGHTLLMASPRAVSTVVPDR